MTTYVIEERPAILVTETMEHAADGNPPFDYKLTVRTCSKCREEVSRDMAPWYGHSSVGQYPLMPHRCKKAADAEA